MPERCCRPDVVSSAHTAVGRHPAHGLAQVGGVDASEDHLPGAFTAYLFLTPNVKMRSAGHFAAKRPAPSPFG